MSEFLRFLPTTSEHQRQELKMPQQTYSSKILDALNSESDVPFSFPLKPEKGRNCAACLTAVLCRRLAATGEKTEFKYQTTYRWAGGVVILRNAIRHSRTFWTNVRPDLASQIHKEAGATDVVYLMSKWSPTHTVMHIWAIPETIIFDALSRLPTGETAGQKSVEIDPQNQAIKNDPEAVNLSPYYRISTLHEIELTQLNKAHEADLSVRKRTRERRNADITGADPPPIEDVTSEIPIDDRSRIDDEQIAVSDSQCPTYTKADALQGLFMEEALLDKILNRLRRKKAVILQGPPGVGKTFVAHRLAYLFMGEQDSQRVKLVQFHPSYGYEDFVQGYRPNGTGLELRNGAFHQFAERARNDMQRDWFFVIDEINRGNLAKIFGELLMLIESDKRGQEHAIPLTYSNIADEDFYLPPNLYIIGTMNTADRSLAMVDYALRRRFAFVNLDPALDSQAFRTWLSDRGASNELVSRIQKRVGALNSEIDTERDLGAGFRIGHSFFCPSAGPIDDAWYREVIESEIQPLLEEYFDSRERVDELVKDLLA